MLSFAYKRFDGHVPEPGPLDNADRALLAQVEAGFETVGELYNACKFRAALNEALALAREANGYTFGALSAGLDRKAPWFQIKEDPAAAATSVYVILRAVDNLKTILAPILPHTPVYAQDTAAHEYLGYDGQFSGTQHVAEYQEEARSHRALTYDHAGAVRTGRRASCRWGRRCASRTAVQEARRKPGRRGVRAAGRLINRISQKSRGACPGFFMPVFHPSEQLVEVVHRERQCRSIIPANMASASALA